MRVSIYSKKVIAAILALMLCCSCSDTKVKDNSSEIKAMEKKIDKLSATIEKLSESINEYNDKEYEYEYDIHKIYDDSAVINAYKSGDSSELNEKDKYIHDSLKEAIDELINDNMSDYEKEKAVYDYIFKNTRFDESSLNAITDSDTDSDNSANPYGFFHDHSVICVGDATTFKLFMDALDIECKIIHSTENGEHAWDQVKIDGDWYHVDVLMDCGIKEPAYAFFNVPDSVKELGDYPWDHTAESDIKCTSTKLCYICANAENIGNIYQLPKKLDEFRNDNKSSAYYSIDIPDGADASAVQKQIQSILLTMVSQYNEFIPLNAVADENGKRICFGVCIFDDEEDYEDIEDIADSENAMDIDYEMLEDNFTEYLGELYDDYDFDDYEY